MGRHRFEQCIRHRSRCSQARDSIRDGEENSVHHEHRRALHVSIWFMLHRTHLIGFFPMKSNTEKMTPKETQPLRCTPSVPKYWCLLSLGVRRKKTIMSFGMIVCCLRRPHSVDCRIQVWKLQQTWEAFLQHEYLDLVTRVGKSISILSQNTDAIS